MVGQPKCASFFMKPQKFNGEKARERRAGRLEIQRQLEEREEDSLAGKRRDMVKYGHEETDK